MQRVKVGVIGCGMISEIYLTNITNRFSNVLEAYACANRSDAAAEKRAEQFHIRKMSTEELLADPEVDVVLDLTVPEAHYEINRKALLAGKHVYSEKPLAVATEEAEELLALAEERGLFVGSAPDTFLGGGLQTCRRLLDDGAIGNPVFAVGVMAAYGPEKFHPNPEFFYRRGAGPLFDMGPYYLTALQFLLGPARRVSGAGSRGEPVRRVLSEESPRRGAEFSCETDTTVCGTIEYENGAIASLTTSWEMEDVYWKSGLPCLTLFGTGGTLILPDPNTFGGIGSSPVDRPGTYVLLKQGKGSFRQVEIDPSEYLNNSRGLGLCDMGWCIRNGGTPRVSGKNAVHIVEIMNGILRSAEEGRYYELHTGCTRPELHYRDGK